MSFKLPRLSDLNFEQKRLGQESRLLNKKTEQLYPKTTPKTNLKPFEIMS